MHVLFVHKLVWSIYVFLHNSSRRLHSDGGVMWPKSDFLDVFRLMAWMGKITSDIFFFRSDMTSFICGGKDTSCDFYINFFFFVINIFYLFFHTQQHNIHSKQTKQNNRHILHVLKVQTKGRERGREKTTTKQVLPPYNHIFYGVNILTHRFV